MLSFPCPCFTYCDCIFNQSRIACRLGIPVTHLCEPSLKTQFLLSQCSVDVLQVMMSFLCDHHALSKLCSSENKNTVPVPTRQTVDHKQAFTRDIRAFELNTAYDNSMVAKLRTRCRREFHHVNVRILWRECSNAISLSDCTCHHL